MEIWHNPRCSKSRQTLQLLRDHGHDPEVRLYLEVPPNVGELRAAVDMLGVEAIGLVRKGEARFAELGLQGADEDALLEAMAENPVLIERPLVIHLGRAALGRPPEAVLRLFE